ncbi:MAG: hypothetical protein CVV27_10460 [Candidatus Melainabacteria bacterium HGW-Melainabacteria-1]|nr:MAG: hypothetical protein CVV27_10460 [Candidatus Melainabacteria bacterium HGW-Melainabacteria-1]
MSITMTTYRALQKLDTNRNGLSVEELRKVDKNQDGTLSAAEAKTAGFAEGDRAQLNRRLSGKLPTATAFVFTHQEMNALKLMAPLHSHFDTIDADRNQLLSAAEMAAAAGDSRYPTEESAAMTAVFKNLSELQLLSNDTTWLPKLPANKYLDKIPLQTYDERGLSRQDMERFMDLAGKSDARVSRTIGAFSSAQYPSIALDAPIFAKGIDSIRPDHIQQGELGDCYFLAAVASLASTPQGKQQIYNMIKEVGQGMVTVHFPGQLPITLDKPTTGELSMYANSGRDGLWLSVLEKAYAKLRNDNPMILAKADPYAMIGSGGLLGTGVSAVTGKSGDTDILMLTSEQSLRLKLQQAVARNSVITAGSPAKYPWSKEDNTPNGLPKSHAYSVLDFDPKNDMVTVRNPWGSTEVVDDKGRPRDGVDDGTFKMPLKEFKATFSMICYGQ